MADKKISELTSATTVNTTDFFPIVQAGTTLKLDFATLLAKLPAQPIVIAAAEAPVSGALSTAVADSLVASAAGATNYTLAAGTQGMQKYISASSIGVGATAVVTVTGGVGVTTITFNTTGQGVHLKNLNGSWYVFGVRGATIA